MLTSFPSACVLPCSTRARPCRMGRRGEVGRSEWRWTMDRRAATGADQRGAATFDVAKLPAAPARTRCARQRLAAGSAPRATRPLRPAARRDARARWEVFRFRAYGWVACNKLSLAVAWKRRFAVGRAFGSARPAGADQWAADGARHRVQAARAGRRACLPRLAQGIGRRGGRRALGADRRWNNHALATFGF